MLFAISPGSDGTGDQRFTASVPFVLSPGRKLQIPEPAVRMVNGIEQLRLEQLQLRYAVSLGAFRSEPAAEVALKRLTAALLWCALDLGIGLHYPRERGQVSLFEKPAPIPDTEPMAHIGRSTNWQETDGHYDANLPVVRPEHKRLIRFEPGQATITVGVTSQNFLAKLEEALLMPTIAAIAEQDKLRLSIELYAGHGFEVSVNAQFITLVTSLEALLPDQDIAPAASVALDAAHAAALGQRAQHATNSPEWNQVDRLLSRIGKLRQEAIGTAMRSFALTVVQRHPEIADAEVTSRALRDAYSVRSRLLHDGLAASDVVAEKLGFLREFVPRLLRTLFLEAAQARTANAP